MSKITNEVRNAIITKAVNSVFKEREENLVVMGRQLGDAVYAHEFGAESVTARLLPKRWHDYTDHVDVSCDGFVRYGTENDCPKESLPMSREQPMPVCQRYERIEIDKGHPLFKMAQALVSEHKAVVHERAALTRKMRSLLAGVTTWKKLRETWPEGEAFFPPEPPKQTTAIVHISLTAEINKALGIKSSTAPATKAIKNAMA